MSSAVDPVAAFQEHLAAIKDEKERSRLLNKVKMKAAVGSSEAPPPADVTRMREYLEREIEIPASLVWPTIAVRGEITTTLGRAGKGKTTYNLNRIFSWSAGRPLFPDWQNGDGVPYLNPDGPLKTLIAENEGNAGMFHQKMGMMLHNGPLTDEEKELALDNLFVHGDGGYSGLKLDNDEGVAKMRKAIESCEPDIVFIEPFRSLWKGEENSSTDMTEVIENIIAMATDYNCAVILSHHEKKGGHGEDDMMSAARGSSVLEGAVAVMENFQSVKDDTLRQISWSKARYLEPPAPTRMEWQRESGWYSWIPQEKMADDLYEALRSNGDEPMNTSDLLEALGEKDNQRTKFNKVLKEMAEDGRITKVPSAPNPNGHGTTGQRWRLKISDLNDSGGLSL